MFSQFEPNVKATIAFLKLLNVKVNNASVNETLQNHPDWPSLLCVSDSLNKWNIPNAAGRVEPSAIDGLPTPFMAHTNDKEHPLSVVSVVTENTVQLYSKNYHQPVLKSKEDFFKTWGGVYVIAEPLVHSGEKDYKLNKSKAFVNAFVPTALLTLLAVLSFVGIYTIINSDPAITAIAIYLHYFILLAGVIVTSLLLWYEIDKNNPLLQKVCTGIIKGDCNAILTGKQSKVFSWLSWSEVGFFYFTGGLLILLFTGNNAIFLLAWLNILALPYTLFSIYYQWRVAKQWCVLCLVVQALLLSGAANIFANNFLAAPLVPSIPFLIKTTFVCLLPVLLWYAIKPDILRLQEAKNTKREYLRIKFNTQIFETLLKKQKQITVAVNGMGIQLGNPAATNTLIKVCNPYCGPCAKAHAKIEELLEENKNLGAQIIFTTANKTDNPAYKPVNHLLAIAAGANGHEIKQALDDWYLADKKDYELFATKYPMNGELRKQGIKIEAMHKWCKAMDVSATPTIFLNGYQLPDAYNIEDLQYFLLE